MCSKILCCLVLLLLLSGCSLLHDSHGYPQIVEPGDRQYEAYLKYICAHSSDARREYKKYGRPVAIKIGSWGCYLLWPNRTTNRHEETDKLVSIKFARILFPTWHIPGDMACYLEKGPGQGQTTVEGVPISGPQQVKLYEDESFTYDPRTGKGVVVIRIASGGNLPDARAYARTAIIEKVVRDKNVVLTTGQAPPPADFSLGKETLRNGLFEIEFEAVR